MSALAAPAAVTSMSNRIDPRATDALGRDTAAVPIALSNDQSKVVEPFTGVVTAAETGAEYPRCVTECSRILCLQDQAIRK